MIVLFTVTILSVSAIGQNAYAGSGMSLSADCSGSVCDVSGTSDRSNSDCSEWSTVKEVAAHPRGALESVFFVLG